MRPKKSKIKINVRVKNECGIRKVKCTTNYGQRNGYSKDTGRRHLLSKIKIDSGLKGFRMLKLECKIIRTRILYSFFIIRIQ